VALWWLLSQNPLNKEKNTDMNEEKKKRVLTTNGSKEQLVVSDEQV